MSGPDILNLPTLKAVDLHDEGDHYRIEATGQGEPTVCPACQSAEMYGHGTQKQRFMDTPMHGKRVMLEITRRRYRCKRCSKTLFASLPDVDSKRLATTRFIRHVEQECLRKTFAELSREVGVDDKTIRHIFDDYIERLQRDIPIETPEVMGIDELKIIGEYRAMITNVEKLALFEMLPSRKKKHLTPYFKNLADKHRVKIVTMDLWSVYRQVVEAELPGRMIVADRFHVVRMANEALERVRKQVRKSLDRSTRLKLKDERFILLTREANLSEKQRELLDDWSAQFPQLGEAYWAKETFHDLYEHGSREDAEKAAQEWLDTLSGDMEVAFRETAGALRNWWEQIFNHYDFPISNGYTESINRIAKDMNRMGRGYSFDVIRARLIYDEKARCPNRKTVRSHTAASKPATAPPDDSMGFSTMEADAPAGTRVVEYGAHIPTLCDLLESGYFE